MCKPLCKMVWWFLKKLNIEIPYDSKKLKTSIQKNSYLYTMVIAALFTIARR